MSCGARSLPRGRATACRCMSRGCARGWPRRAPTAAGWSVTRAATCWRCGRASATSTAGSRRSTGHGGRARTASSRVAREGVEEALGVWRGQPLGGVEREQPARRRARAAGGGAAGRGDRGDRARPRAGPPRRAAGPAGGAGHRASLQGAPGGAADAGAVSLRTTGRRAGGLPQPRAHGSWRSSASSPPSRCASCTRTSSSTPTRSAPSRRAGAARRRRRGAGCRCRPTARSVATATSSRSVSGCARARCGCSRSPAPAGSARRGSRWRPPARSRRTSPTARASSRSLPLHRAEDVPAAIVQALGIDRPLGRVSRRGRPNASWPPSTCCWSPTTSSTCWPPRRSSAGCSKSVRRSRSWPPAASRSRCRPRSATRWRRSRCPSPGRPTTRRRWRASTPSRCSASAREPTTPTSTLPTPTPPPSRRSAGASTGCRWRSSSRPPAADCCPPAEIAERLDTALGALGRRRAATRPRASRRCARRSTGATTCSSDDEQQCFARFAVFAGGATVEAAETVTAREPRHARPPGRQEPARAPPAGQRADPAGDARDDPRLRRASASPPTPTSEAVREHHYRYYLALAQRHGTERALWGAGAREHLARLDAEIDNLHAALGWAIAQADAERALAMAAALGCYWVMRNRYADAVDWIDQALSLPGADAHPALRVRALRTKARCLWADGARSRATRDRGRDRRRSPDGSAIP